MSGWADDLEMCPGCSQRRVVAIAVSSEMEGLQSVSCLSCGETSWRREGRPATLQEILQGVGLLWPRASARS